MSNIHSSSTCVLTILRVNFDFKDYEPNKNYHISKFLGKKIKKETVACFQKIQDSS